MCRSVGSLGLELLVVLGARVMMARARRHGRFVRGFHKEQIGKWPHLAAHLGLVLPVVHMY